MRQSNWEEGGLLFRIQELRAPDVFQSQIRLFSHSLVQSLTVGQSPWSGLQGIQDEENHRSNYRSISEWMQWDNGVFICR
jgi:hypothetical protein